MGVPPHPPYTGLPSLKLPLSLLKKCDRVDKFKICISEIPKNRFALAKVEDNTDTRFELLLYNKMAGIAVNPILHEFPCQVQHNVCSLCGDYEMKYFIGFHNKINEKSFTSCFLLFCLIGLF